MARGTQFSTLVTMLRSELRRSTSVAVGVDDLASLKQTLSRTQETLYDSFDWPHLRQISSLIPLSAGQRYYDVPSTFNFDRIERAVVFYNDRPYDIERGIDFEQYATYNSDNDERADPAQKWDIRWTGTREQIEFWPIPASNDGSAQYRSIRKLRTLVNDSDPCDLDDQLIVLFAAAELGAGAEMKDAGAKLQLAQARLAVLKANAKSTYKSTKIGLKPATGEVPAQVVVRVR